MLLLEVVFRHVSHFLPPFNCATLPILFADPERMSSWEPLNVKNVLNALAEVSEWHSLGIQLDILPHKLRELEEYPPQQRKFLMITQWLDNDPAQTWEKLLNGLKRIGHNRVAENIVSQYRKAPSSGRVSIEKSLAETAITTPSPVKVPQHQEGMEIKTVQERFQ